MGSSASPDASELDLLPGEPRLADLLDAESAEELRRFMFDGKPLYPGARTPDEELADQVAEVLHETDPDVEAAASVSMEIQAVPEHVPHEESDCYGCGAQRAKRRPSGIFVCDRCVKPAA